MNSRVLFIMMIALAFAGGAAFIAYRWVESQPGQNNNNENVIALVVASTEIPFGSIIENTHVKLSNFPKDSYPKGAFMDTKLVIGKITGRKYINGEVLLKSKIKNYLGGSFLSALIQKGMRAVTVRVNDVLGVGGFIAPGNKVDIIATRKGGTTHNLLVNVKVLAVGQQASHEQEKAAVVNSLTLEVTPEQAKKVISAKGKGSLHFTLRNLADDEGLESEVIETATKEIEVIEVLDVVEDEIRPSNNKKRKIKKPTGPAFKMIPWGQKNGDEFDDFEEG